MSRESRPLFLCYHAVSDVWADPLAVRPSALERQLRDLIGRGYRPARLEDALDGQGRLLHVTFDDAYRSVTRALPILEALRVHATIFACTGFAGDGRPLMVPELAVRGADFRDELSTMDWDALRDLAGRGVEIGSHTVSHAHLTQLSDEELGRELRESRERLQTELGRPCRYLAYPYGEQDTRVRRAARAAGYEAAFGLRANADPVDLYGVPRLDIYRRDGRVRFRLKTSFARRPISALLRARIFALNSNPVPPG